MRCGFLAGTLYMHNSWQGHLAIRQQIELTHTIREHTSLPALLHTFLSALVREAVPSSLLRNTQPCRQ